MLCPCVSRKHDPNIMNECPERRPSLSESGPLILSHPIPLGHSQSDFSNTSPHHNDSSFLPDSPSGYYSGYRTSEII